ncbi:MAG: GntR family transcriptional regulator [Acidobacteria bacterium]|nr:GntR family transcriptional regulator [Acidobacteriota bacterium]
MIFRLNPNSGVPIYLQIMEQIKHAVENGVLRPGDQLPGMRKLAETMVMNPNTVAKAYRELEHEGLIELRQGAGAFISENLNTKALTDRMQTARPIVDKAVERLLALGLSEEEIKRLIDAAIAERAQK